MALTNDLISQFVKITTDNKKSKVETTVYGTIVEYDGSKYIRIDGSDLLTPIETTADVMPDERVTALIKNHSVVVTGNISSPSVRKDTVEDLSDEISEFESIYATVAKVEDLEVERGRIDTLVSENATIKERLTAAEANISTLETDYLTVNETLTANKASIDQLQANALTVTVADAKYATIEELDAVDARLYNLESTYGDFSVLTAERLDAAEAFMTNVDLTYANVDFSNITQAAIEYFYATSGLIEDVIVGEGTVTGRLVGVTISGDIIEAGTLIADKLVIQGEDGLYYKLNTDGMATEAEQTEYNSLNGSVIMAKSITATQISVTDLVAFDATIGGFTITDNSIFSDVKDGEGNSTRGIYMDTDGQINFGDISNYVKYYRDEDGTYKLAISADSILYTLNGSQHSVADIGALGEYVSIGTYEGEPCIELGEKDSEFKLLITNTRMIFMAGSNVPAYFNNRSMHIKKAIIDEELQQGDFVWMVRSNGNLGLMWKGVST